VIVMRAVLAVLLLLPLAACEIVYKLPTRQGNVIEQKDLDKVALGMTRDQVRFILGTPIAASALRSDRWDYYGYYKPPRGAAFSRTVSLFFDGDKLVRMEGEKAADGSDTPDIEASKAERKKAALEEERAKEEKKDGGIITPPDQQEHKDSAPDQ
jgi:outer membrane protein assembly factor BamE (lipoprotein component of BamABCDE complex)